MVNDFAFNAGTGLFHKRKKRQSFKAARLRGKVRLAPALLKQERQDDLGRATRTIVKRVEKCIEVDSGIFEHLLLTVAIY